VQSGGKADAQCVDTMKLFCKAKTGDGLVVAWRHRRRPFLFPLEELDA
jgi:hypothetical protein